MVIERKYALIKLHVCTAAQHMPVTIANSKKSPVAIDASTVLKQATKIIEQTIETVNATNRNTIE